LGNESNRLEQWSLILASYKMILLVIGGAIGTYARFELGRWIQTQAWTQGFPYGTLFINISGSFLLGVIAAVVQEHLAPEHHHWYLVFGTGFCGGYTTFSAFELETYKLVQDGSWWLAGIYVVGSVVAGFAGVVLAMFLVNSWFPKG
jgi:fluoride exporter